MEGWIKLHRKLTQWEWYTDSKMIHLFIHLLISANRQQGKWRGIQVERGQMITGINSLSEATGISAQSIRTCLNRLKSTSEITIKSTNKYSMITICNYDSYQIEENKSTSKSTSKLTNNQQTTNKQLTPNKNENNENNEKNNNPPLSPQGVNGENEKTWRNSLEVYLTDCEKNFLETLGDFDFILKQEKLNPGIDVRLSIEKAYENFWHTEAGWRHKKKSKIAEINWRLTFANAISLNKVYTPKGGIHDNQRQPTNVKTVGYYQEVLDGIQMLTLPNELDFNTGDLND